jgi:DNA-binding CsgD family transcriptional regulator
MNIAGRIEYREGGGSAGDNARVAERAVPRAIEPKAVPRRPATGSPWAFAWPAALFTLITFFVGADMAADLTDGVSLTHLVIEMVAFALCLGGAAGTAMQLRGALRRARQLERDLDGTRADLEGTRADLVRWRDEAKDLLEGLRGAIDLQFQRWELTSAQGEVALLVLKGFSYKEIADLRETTERTVRNQAVSIYRKAGVANRAEMAAFFLEDFLVPPQQGRSRAAQPLSNEGAGSVPVHV